MIRTMNARDGWSDVEDVVDQESDLDASDFEDSDDDDSGDDNDDDSEDEEAALQAELAKIRAEREAAKAKADALADKEEKSQLEEAALVGNPLLADGTMMWYFAIRPKENPIKIKSVSSMMLCEMTFTKDF